YRRGVGIGQLSMPVPESSPALTGYRVDVDLTRLSPIRPLTAIPRDHHDIANPVRIEIGRGQQVKQAIPRTRHDGPEWAIPPGLARRAIEHANTCVARPPTRPKR